MAVPFTLSSVPAQTPYVQYVSSAGQTVFPYPFEITQDSDLVCLINGVAQPTDGGYTLSGQGNTNGGNLTFAVGQTAGTIITLYRNISIARITQFAQNGTFFSANFNNEFNRVYLIMQQLQEAAGFYLQVPNTNVPSGAGTILTPALYANKGLSFDVNGNPVPFALVSSALTQTTFNSFLPGVTFIGSASDGYSDAYFNRTAAYSGGTPGHVSTCLTVETSVTSASAANYEWAFLAQMNNSATGGNNLAAYMQGNKEGNVGPTWGAVIEVIEQTHINNPAAGTVALELDVSVNGTDNSGAGNRIGCNVVVRRQDKTGGAPAAQANWGYRIDSSDTGASVGFGYGFFPGSTANVGFDTSQATMTTAAYMMATSQPIIFDGPTTKAQQVAYDGVGLAYTSSGVKGLRLAPTALQIITSGTLVQVVGPQQSTSVAAATFVQVDTTTAVSTDSTFDGYTLKQVVKALRIHGLLA